jgi:hypothetical protein
MAKISFILIKKNIFEAEVNTMTKKIITVFLSLALVAFAGTAFANSLDAWSDNGATIGGTSGTQTLTVTTSPNGKFNYVASTDGGTYVVMTGNMNGTRLYGAQFDYEAIIMSQNEIDFVKDEALPTLPTSTDDWGTGWVVMGDPDATLPSGGS